MKIGLDEDELDFIKKTAVLAIDLDGHYCQAWSIFCSVLDKRYTFNRFYRMKAAYIHYMYVYMYIYIHIYIYIYTYGKG